MKAQSHFPLSDVTVESALVPFGVHATGEQIRLIQAYVQLLLKWNRVISLTTVRDPAEIVARHFGESMFAQPVLAMDEGNLVDVGSGAGFPGLALKIVAPSLRICLIESNQKKAAFLAEAVRTLGLTGVEIAGKRFDETQPSFGQSDFITARALGGFSELLRWAAPALVPRGKIVLWIGLEDAERIAATAGWIWQPAIKIPESQRRYLLIGRPAP